MYAKRTGGWAYPLEDLCENVRIILKGINLKNRK
jgi:hypothetical protein